MTTHNETLFSYVHPAQYQSLFQNVKQFDTSRGAILRSIENQYSSLKRKGDGEKDKRRFTVRKTENDREKSLKSERSVLSFKTRNSYDDENNSSIFQTSQKIFKTARSQSLFSNSASRTNLNVREELNLKRPKYTPEQKIKKLYLSKVLGCKKYNLVRAFRNWKGIQNGVQSKKPSSKWTKRAAEILARNSKLSTQKSLWRLKYNASYRRIEERAVTEPSPMRRSFSKHLNIMILPEQTVDYSRHHCAILALTQIHRTYQTQSIISKFKDNFQRCAIISNYFRKFTQNAVQNTLTCLRKLKLDTFLNYEQTHNYRKKRFEKFFNNLQLRKERYVFGCFKLAWQTVQWKKDLAVRRLTRAWTRRMGQAVSKWKSWTLKTSHNRKQTIDAQVLKFGEIALRRLLRSAFHRVCLQGSNKWFRRAASKLALNCKTSLQNSLWRLDSNIVQV